MGRLRRRRWFEVPEEDSWITERGAPAQSGSPRMYQHDSGSAQQNTPSSGYYEKGIRASRRFSSYIRKLPGKNKWRVYSEEGRNLGTYDSLKAAKERLRQVHFFKNKKGSIGLVAWIRGE